MKRGTNKSRWLLAGAAALAISAATAPASAGQRPLSDFLSQQGAWCVATNDAGIDCAASHYGGPASCGPDEFTFVPVFSFTDPQTGVIAFVDSLDAVNENVLGGILDTTLDGSVTESKLPGGFADVKVTLHTSNALTRAFDGETGEILFGYSSGEVLDGAPPTLGESFMQITFSNTALGAPLPDFAQLQICPAPGQQLEMLSIRAQASGPLRAAFGVPEGTPGRFEMTQTGLIGTAAIASPHSRVAVDAFPAEKIIIRATGH